MDRFARFTISNARAAILLIVSILVAGTGVFLTQPRQEDPEILIRQAQVVTRVPGLSPERMEALVTLPIEEAVKQIPEVEEIESVSYAGTSIVGVHVEPRYTELTPIWTKLRNKMEDVAPSLPEAAVGPKVNDDYGRLAVVTLALTGSDYTMAELHEVAKDLRDELSTLALVAKVDLYGVQPERIWLEFDTGFLSQFELEPAQIFDALKAQNLVLPAGTVRARGEQVVIEASGDFGSVQEIERFAIPTPGGDVLYLRDMAQIRRGYVEPPESPAFYDGKPAIVLGISMVENSNVVALGRQVQARLAQLAPRLPVGMELDVVIFQPDLVQAAVNDSVVNLLQTVVVVLVVVMAFLGWRMGLIVGAMVPLAMMVTLVGMFVGNIALHRISIAAIIVALGLLVDNGVVVAEDIRRRIDLGTPRLEAAFATPRQLAVPLLTSSLTTILAFMPLMLVSDSTGEFLRSLGQVLTLALLASWLLSISLTPALCHWFLPADRQGSATSTDAPGSGPAYAGYRRLLTFLLARRVPFLGGVLLLLVASTQVFGLVKQRSLGPSPRNQFTAYLDLPAQADIQETMAAAQVMSRFLNDDTRNPEVTDVLAYVGGGGPRFFLALNPPEAQPNKAFLVVNTQQADQVPRVMERTEAFILEHLPQATGRADILFLGPAPLGTVELRLRGPDPDVLRRKAAQIEDVFYAIPGTQAVRQDWENSVLKMRVEVDQDRARRAGVSSPQIASTLSTIFDGTLITRFREGDKSIPIVLRAREEDRSTLDSLRSAEVRGEGGVAVPLLQIANFEGVVRSSRIRRVDQEKAITVAGKHPDMTAAELHARMQSGLAGLNLPPGYELTVEGELQGAKESSEKLFLYAPHALFGILLLLVLQFNSFRRPAIILMTIPLVLVGASASLAISGAYFDFTGLLGLFSLAGIIINNGIVLIDRIDEARTSGMSVDDAVIDASLARARPIIMTTITTVVGLIPLALSGGEFWFGMSMVIMGGLSVGTLLTLGFVPVLYSLLFRFKRA